ncbi:MAG: hypothetical protein GF313_16250 [Caldithrix sp.]|nr:hypothetical protein [Caldithrix sp.]
MRFFIKSFLILLLVVSVSKTQEMSDIIMDDNQNNFNGGLGMTWIDGTSYTTFNVAPEFALGKFGVGLNIELLFNNSEGFKFRKEGWDKGAGALRMIRYLRWGVKNDPLYVRVGSLQSATLGNGFIMGYYSNEADYDRRKIGLVFDADFDAFGFESMTSNLGDMEIVGGRAYVRPLLATGIPFIKNLEFGATYATDLDPDNRNDTNDGIYEWGADIGLPIIQTKVFNSSIYGDYAKINHYGEGKAFGIKAGIPNFIGVFGLYAKLEKRFLGDQFLPNYFNTLYELERKELAAEYYGVQGLSLTKEDFLAMAEAKEGIFGELAGQILGKITLLGNYQSINNTKNSGILHLEARSKDLIPNVRLLYTYDKVGIETFEDVRTLDNRSVAIAEIGYRTYQYIYVTLQYRWNFRYNPETDSYEPQERFQPQVSFAMEF